ncbi:hypothetical protein [Streptomyces sp. NPDC091416]|uniref:hypothetical protein n=1 Tax=Streptomyces sp. NPDC091416 TaxID=3366003 RepID=UPI003819BB14
MEQLQAWADAKGLITLDISVDSTIARAHQHAADARQSGICRSCRPAASSPSPTTTGWDLACGISSDDHWYDWFDVHIHAEALQSLGLHPEQSASQVTVPSPPRWWHAAADRRTRW